VELRELLIVLVNVVVDCAIIGNSLVDIVYWLSFRDLLERNQLLGELWHEELKVDIVG
jgi:hypothetical protein